MIDTHSHLLPGLDHGCPDLATSLLMAREAAASGVGTVVCTPHLPEWDQALVLRAREVIEEVRGALATAGISLALALGFEADLGIALTNDLGRLRPLVIEGTPGAIVFEMPYRGWPVYMEETIFRLSTSGFVPVLAHPERNERIQGSSELLVGCLRAGAVAQATAASVGGDFDRASEQAFYRLLSEGLISLLASDAHAHRHDGWTLAPVLATLAGRVGTDALELLTETNPRRLLSGERPEPVTVQGAGAPRYRSIRRKRKG